MKKILKEIRDIDLLLQIVKDTEVKLNLLSQQKTAVEDLQVELNKKLVSISNKQRIRLKHVEL